MFERSVPPEILESLNPALLEEVQNMAAARQPSYARRQRGANGASGAQASSNRRRQEIFNSNSNNRARNRNAAKKELVKPEELELCKNQLSSIKPRPIIDQDSLVCLLTLFFVPEKHVNRAVFNSILQNLLFTTETKVWLAKSLIEILQLTNSQVGNDNSRKSSEESRKFSSDSRKSSDDKMDAKMAEIPELYINPSKKVKNSESPVIEKTGEQKLVASKLSMIQANWLNFQVDMSLGHRANVFFFYKPDEISDSDSTSYLRNGVEHKVRLVVNPQACSFVDKNVLDTISEVNNHIIDTLFWLKNDIATTTKTQGNLFQRLLQLDQGTSLNDSAVQGGFPKMSFFGLK